MLNSQSADLLAALRSTLPGWRWELDGDRVTFTRGNREPSMPPRRVPSWPDVLTTLTSACAEHGISRARPLPLRGLDGAELTFSAVQALDPYLKHRQNHTYGQGFVSQPVVRFTGKRDESGGLLPGFLTSFVNASIVQPIDSIDEHAGLIDAWLGALSRLGFHTKHLTISGSLAIWHRAPVAGITLRFHHEDLMIADAVLLWNADGPSQLATDIGSGLERLMWGLTRRPWLDTVFGRLAAHADGRILDAVRTATLIVGSGVVPASRGPGSAVRRLLRPELAGCLGLSRVVRWAHWYWSLVGSLSVPWPEVCRVLESEAFDDPRPT